MAPPHAASAGSAPSAEAAERGLTQAQRSVDAEIRETGELLHAGGSGDMAISRLIALARKLLDSEALMHGCGSAVREQEIEPARMCEAKIACERRFGTQRSRQMIELLKLLSERPNGEAVAFARTLALDPFVGPLWRAEAVATLERAAPGHPEASAQVASVREDLAAMKQFHELNQVSLSQVGMNIQRCRAGVDRDIQVVATVAPDGSLTRILSPLPRDPPETCILDLLQRARFRQLVTPRPRYRRIGT